MDLNLVVLLGRLASPPELRVFDSGTRLLRLLLTVRTEEPRRRVDVLPVVVWDPPEELLDPPPEQGRGVWVSGTLQRRFVERSEGHRSRLEVVAEQVMLREPTDEEVG